VGEMAKALGMPSEVEFRGVVYKMQPWTNEVMAQFESWLERRAWQAYDRAKKNMSPGEAREMRTDLLAAISAGDYSFGSAAVAEALQSKPGIAHMLYLLLSQNKGVTPDLVEEMVAEDMDRMLQAMDTANAGDTAPEPADEGEPPDPTPANAAPAA